jgi:hypothetical protein
VNAIQNLLAKVKYRPYGFLFKNKKGPMSLKRYGKKHDGKPAIRQLKMPYAIQSIRGQEPTQGVDRGRAAGRAALHHAGPQCPEHPPEKNIST